MKTAVQGLVGVLVLLLVCAASPGWAHKVNLFAYVEDDRVHVEGYFVDGTPSRDSKIVVYAADGSVVSEGFTDQEGRYSFAAPSPQPLRLAMEASMGHRNEITLPASELGPADTPSSDATGAQSASPAPSSLAGPPSAAPIPADPGVFEQILARRLRPLQETLLKIQQSQERPGIAEVLGGIGYIVGLAGVYLWASSRRKS